MGIIPYGAYNPSNAKLVTAASGYPSNYEHYSNFEPKALAKAKPKLTGPFYKYKIDQGPTKSGFGSMLGGLGPGLAKKFEFCSGWIKGDLVQASGSAGYLIPQIRKSKVPRVFGVGQNRSIYYLYRTGSLIPEID